MLTDQQLLASYVRERCESSFAELVQRHLGLVYSAALRECEGDAGLAEDVAQEVFTHLARKASSLAGHPALAGWLYTSVRHCAANQRRANRRRWTREQEATTMNEADVSAGARADWVELRPVIDDAMHELPEADRAAVALRFFEERSLREVGEMLGLNENAARMRVDRALDKLQAALARRGIKSTAAGLTAAIAFGAISSAPSSLAATVTSSALAGATTAISATTLTLEALIMTKAQIGLTALLLAAAIGIPTWQQGRVAKVQAENEVLRRRAASVDTLTAEVEQLRKAAKPLVSAEELERLRESQKEVLQLRAKLSGELRSGAVAAAKAKKAEDEAGATNQIAGAMSEMVKGVMEQQTTTKLAQMKEKLKLTAEQEQAIGAILRKQADFQTSAAQRMFSGKLSNEDMKQAQEVGNSEKDIKALLSPEQLTQYDDYKKEELSSNARLAANGELLQIQNLLGLSTEQQNQVFPVLVDELTKQLNGSVTMGAGDAKDPEAVLRRTMDGKVKSLEGILTPTQLETYRQYQEKQLSMIRAFMPKAQPPQPPQAVP